MQDVDLKAAVNAYLEAYDQRDLAACIDFFSEDATIHFGLGVYRGRQAIEEWHRDRFAADLRITRVEGIRPRGSTVVVDGVATSNTARAWGFDEVAGRATIVFHGEKIGEVKFGLRTSVLEGW
jgi:ketosteroid isomerase-like protein